MIHTFLRSIGFGDLTKNADLYLILESILNRPDEQNIVKDEYGNEFACFSKSFGTDIGITVCGNFINDKEFRMEYYYPYLHGSQITTCETIEIERHAAREAFAGIHDLNAPAVFGEITMDRDAPRRLGINTIFDGVFHKWLDDQPGDLFLQNPRIDIDHVVQTALVTDLHAVEILVDVIDLIFDSHDIFRIGAVSYTHLTLPTN